MIIIQKLSMDSLQPTTPQSPKSRTPLAVVLSVVITALVVGAAVFVLTRRMGDNSQADLQARVDQLQSDLRDATANATNTTNTANTSANTTATNTTNTTGEAPETASWKTYSNNTYKFSVKYPPTLIADFSETSKMLSIYDPTKARPNTVLTVNVTPSTKTLDQYIASLKDSSLIGNEQKTTLDGVIAYEGVDMGILSQYGVYTVYNGTEYLLRFMSNNKDTLPDVKDGLSTTQKLMLASFTFTK